MKTLTDVEKNTLSKEERALNKTFDFKLLEKLCTVGAVSGFEENLVKVIVPEIKDFCHELYTDNLGNLICFKKGKTKREKPFMVCAHMDEVGFCISGVNDDGTLSFNQVGMTSDVLPSKRVKVGKSALSGVICARPVHLMTDKDSSISIDDLCIDIGCRDKNRAASLDLVGEQAWFDSDFCTFGNGLVKSKALDDRIGCTIMCSLIKEDLEYDTYFVFTVGEELGGVGASAATTKIAPDKCLVLEGTTAADIPGNEGVDRVCVLGDGPVCPFMDGGTLYNKEMYTSIRKIARENGIDSQTKTKIAGGTDAARISQCLSGVKVAAISLACRYIHTSSSVASTKDAKDMLELARLVVNSNI